MAAKNSAKRDIASENFQKGYSLLAAHPMFSSILTRMSVNRSKENLCPEKGWAMVYSDGIVHAHPTRVFDPQEWVYVLAHCCLHLGMSHFKEKNDPIAWNVACDCYVAKFLADLKLGRSPSEVYYSISLPGSTEEKLYNHFIDNGIKDEYRNFGTAGEHIGDMIISVHTKYEKLYHRRSTDWVDYFAHGLTLAVQSAVNVAGGAEESLSSHKSYLTSAEKAKRWFVNSYPLLGVMAAGFKIIEDPLVCSRMEISIAAVDAYMKEIYMNPAAGLSDDECCFIMAHELLHVGLCHQVRCQGRDPYLWNVACDYVINGWLVEMGLGDLPSVGALYDPDLKGLSSESVYDRIVTDIRRNRKLMTLRGYGLGDMLDKAKGDWWTWGDGITLDEFYRKCMSQGLAYHEADEREFLPVGLIEEIRALSQPPVPWDVELAQWFDNYFSPIEKVRTYTRLSRRQSASPDIPRPRWVQAGGAEDGRTYGVIIDTSGSMDRKLLAKALGAIASYSTSRDVPMVRVIFCDALAYDQGYMSPEAIADSVKVKGRGGTVLQPAVDMLEKAEDFPPKGPILIITDCQCDKLVLHREHAYLIPQGRNLPFVPRGKVFRFS